MSKRDKKLSSEPTFTFDPNLKPTIVARRGQAAWNAEMTRHHKALYIMLMAALHVRYGMEDPKEWLDLCADPYWNHRKEKNRPRSSASPRKKSMFVALFMFAGPKEIGYDRSWKYGCVIEHYYRAKIEAAKLIKTINDDGGIEKVLKKFREDNLSDADGDNSVGNRAKSADADDSVRSEDEEDDDESEQEDGGKNSDGEPAEKPKATKTPPRLVIEVTYEELMQAMSWPFGDKLRVVAVREPDRGKYKVFRAVKLGSPGGSSR